MLLQAMDGVLYTKAARLGHFLPRRLSGERYGRGDVPIRQYLLIAYCQQSPATYVRQRTEQVGNKGEVLAQPGN
jgi:hypothetical protein